MFFNEFHFSLLKPEAYADIRPNIQNEIMEWITVSFIFFFFLILFGNLSNISMIQNRKNVNGRETSIFAQWKQQVEVAGGSQCFHLNDHFLHFSACIFFFFHYLLFLFFNTSLSLFPSFCLLVKREQVAGDAEDR